MNLKWENQTSGVALNHPS